MYRISNIMTKDIITVDVEDSLYQAAKLMKQYNIGFIPVLDGDVLAGVVTDRDLVVRGLAENKSEKAKIKEVMTEQCIAVHPDTTVDEAVQIMSENKIRRLCVVKNNKLAGICAIGDIAVKSKLLNDAGRALNDISSPTRQQVSGRG